MTVDAARLREVAAPLGALVALVGVAFALGLEQAAGLPGALAVAAAGWVLHEAAPARFRPWVFLGIGAVVAGWRLGADALVVGAGGLALAEVAALPVRRAARAALLLAGAVGLALARRSGALPVGDAALALLGALGMFRAGLLARDPAAAGADRLARWTYLFQWPNALFLLYPVVDWDAWTRAPATPLPELHRRGVRWIARGFSHLLAYRLVYHLVLPADWEVVDAPSLLWWMLGSLGLYVRISGTFHVIAGLLLLFGRDLPRPQNRYFLASSMSDHYRRVNTYWTAFVEQVVFVPVWFWLRRRKVPHAPVLAVVPTFAASWALHHWQSFWITGRLVVGATETAFWAILGVLVAVNTAWAASRPPGPRRVRYLPHALRVVATFSAMAVLWSLWKSPTFDLWLARMRLLVDDPTAVGWLAVGLGGVALAGAAVHWALDRRPVSEALARAPRWAGAPALAAAALAVAWPLPEGAPGWAVAVRSALAAEHLSRADQVAKTHGYYDDLGPVRVVDPALLVEPPPGWVRLRETAFARPTPPDVPFEFELVPGARGLFHGAAMSVNSHGMRDREYTLEKPPGTYRIALLGASPELGEGVSDGEVFEARAEAALARRAAPGRRIEILNFAVSARTLDAAVVVYPEVVRPFRPDLVLLADHTTDGLRTVIRLGRARREGRAFPGEVAGALVDELAGERRAVVAVELEANAAAIVRDLQDTLVREVTADGAKLVWLYVPVPADLDQPPDPRLARRAASAVEAGMIPIDLSGAYGRRSRAEVAVAPWDDHPNALGHRLLARRLVAELVARDAELGLGLAVP